MEKSPKIIQKRTRKSSKSEASSSKNTQDRVSNSDNIDAFLISKGFAPITRIHMKHPSSKDDNVSFIKAFTDLGHMCYVKLDIDQPIKRDNDLSLTKVDTISKEPIKDGKLSVDECGRLDVCGVAYECNEGICVLRRDLESLDLLEDTFTVTEPSSLLHGFEKREPLAYPIVLYSEIVANEQAVMWNIARSTARLKMKAIHNYNKELMAVRSSILRFTDVAGTLVNALHAARDNVINKSNALYKLRDTYELPINTEDRYNYSSIINNLHTCDDLMGDLILTSRTLSTRRNDIDNLTNEFITYFEELKLRYT